MEYETKKWVVRWTRYSDADGAVITCNSKIRGPQYKRKLPNLFRKYDRQFDNAAKAFAFYDHQVRHDVFTAQLIRIDVKNNEYVLGSIDRVVPVTYSDR